MCEAQDEGEGREVAGERTGDEGESGEEGQRGARKPERRADPKEP